MNESARFGIEALAVVALTWALPWVGMSMLVPSLAESPLAQRTNFHGRNVFVGLGAVWIFWVAGMVVLRWSGQLAGHALSVLTALGAISPLVITALLFGLLDDAYGSAGDRGFRGHLKALSHGRLTTGAFKLVGIGLVSVAAGTSIAGGASGVQAQTGGLAALGAWPSLVPAAAWTLALAAVIALSANLVNLLDLRPGRALKGFGVYALALVIGALVSRAATPAATVLLALALFGPLVAIWRFDLGERGMLGDAGANAAGALLGFVAAWECGRSWAALVVLALLLAFNLASERWSFSRVIADNRLLSVLDGLGRLPQEAPGEENSAKTSPLRESSDG